MRSAIKAHRWTPTIVSGALFGLIAWFNRSVLATIPGFTRPLPLRALLAIGVVIVALTPLYSSFPVVESTLACERLMRLVRVTLSSTLAMIVTLPALLGSSDESLNQSSEVKFFLIILAVGILSVVAGGNLGWMAPLAISIIALIVDTAPSRPISSFLSPTWLWPATVSLVVIAAY
ncbi:MAG: hypothetical protein ACRC0L_03765, partial [Angustibacter sp.]